MQQKSESQVRKVLSEIVERNHGAGLCEYTCESWFAHWLGRIKPEVTIGTYDRYSHAVAGIRAVHPELSAKKLDRVTIADIEDLRSKLHAVRNAGTTNFTLKAVRMAFKRAGALILHNPAVGVRAVKKTKEEILANGEGKQPFTNEQLKLLMSKADDEWKGMILAGLYSAGQRLVDIPTHTQRQVDLEGGVVRFCTEKTARDTIIPIMSAWREDLEKRTKGLAPGAPVFPRVSHKV
ncbi:MAG: site-specific integrase, partial [Opitutaceae bacterium]